MGQLRRLVDDYYRTLGTRGLQAAGAYWGLNCEFAAPGARGRGAEFISSYIEPFYLASPDLRHTVTSSVEAGDTIALEVAAEGTNTGPLRLPTGEIPATGRPWRVPGCVMIRMNEGRFMSYHIYFDMAEFLGQLELMPLALTV
jgi:ketosteroid isomerase-like protein